jgi:hypothetical protein
LVAPDQGAQPNFSSRSYKQSVPDSNEIGHLVPLALVVAMVCIMQTSAVASTFPSEKSGPDDVSRDFAGVGAGSIVTGLIGSFAVDASPPSTAIVVESGGRSQIASITAVAVMIALAVLAAGLTSGAESHDQDTGAERERIEISVAQMTQDVTQRGAGGDHQNFPPALTVDPNHLAEAENLERYIDKNTRERGMRQKGLESP